MIALVHSELLKLRTLRSTAWAALALLAITLLTAGLALGDAGEKNIRTPQELRDTILAVGYAAVFFLAVLGAIAAAGEYRHRTISQRFLASPARHRVLLAKLAAYALVGTGTAVVVTAVASALGQAVVSSKGYTLDLGDGGLRMTAGIVLATAFAAMLGVVVGAITRNPTTAMVDDLRRLDRRQDHRRLDRRGCPVPPVLAARERARPRRGHRLGLRRARPRRHDRRARACRAARVRPARRDLSSAR